MLKVDAKAKANMSGVASKVSRISKDKGLGRVLASQASMGMDKFVPKRTGALAASVSVDISGFKVIYNAPYAVYVYNGRGKKFNRDKNPNATARWDEAYKAAGGDRQLAEVGTAYLRSH